MAADGCRAETGTRCSRTMSGAWMIGFSSKGFGTRTNLPFPSRLAIMRTSLPTTTTSRSGERAGYLDPAPGAGSEQRMIYVNLALSCRRLAGQVPEDGLQVARQRQVAFTRDDRQLCRWQRSRHRLSHRQRDVGVQVAVPEMHPDAHVLEGEPHRMPRVPRRSGC